MSGWEGGFGDALSVEEVLRAKERLLYYMAYERVPLSDVEDAVQEARITIWQEMEKRPDVAHSYLHAAARNRMSSYRRYRRATGAPIHQGRPQAVEVASVDILKDTEYAQHDKSNKDMDATLLLIAQEVLDTVEIAYHRGQIVKAINSLGPTHRDYVWHRFWGELTNAEIGAKIGVQMESLNSMWNKRTKPALALQLSHLAAV